MATTVRYFDAVSEHSVERPVVTDDDVMAAVGVAGQIRTGRGTAAVVVERGDGSTLTWASDGERAALIWIDYLGQSFHSTGGVPGPSLIYDYFGSWSEVPSEWALPASKALKALVHFAAGGNEIGVTFELD
mgnify:CR=1 FL=1